MTDTTAQLPALAMPDLDAEIAGLAAAHRRANGPVMSLINRIGGGVERQLASLPAGFRTEVERLTIHALIAAHGAASLGQGAGQAGTMAAVMASGAMGGAGGLPTAIAELPVTVTVLLAAIRQEAAAAGFNPSEPGIRAACLEVFSAGSPLVRDDDGVNMSFLSARMTLTGPALNKLIATVAPKLAAALGQKLAAQSVPVLGAVSGAALNAAFLRYYREVARIRFQLMRLSVQYGAERVAQGFAAATEPPRITEG